MRRHLLGAWICLVPATAFGQAVTPADLEGYVVEARVVMDQQLRREGREFPAKLNQQLRVKFYSDNTIEFELSSVSQGPRGPRQVPTRKGRTTLGNIVEARDLDGGQALWSFENGALTSLRIFGNAGGYKRTVRFARDGNGMTCTVNGTYVREEGVGRVATRSALDNVPITILSSKQSSSACKVSKDPAS